ncbi:MAG: type IV pilus biogenesis/stability protein PilW [Porticoccaceae bacterium]|nr:MAG: type IV pilus biogenesis/stability protein PilW [Porticoccaceae bacterium]
MGNPWRCGFAAVIAVALLMVVGCTTTTTTSSETLVASSGEKTGAEKRQDALNSYIELGLGYIGENNRDQARLNLLRALEIDSRSPAANNGMALLYQLERDSARAEEYFKKALGYDRDFTQARNNYAVFLVTQNRLDEAYEQFLQASRDVNYQRRPQVFLSLGAVAAKLGKTAEAKDAWERAMALDRELPGPYLELASLYFDQGDFPEAKRFLDRHAQLAPASARSLWLAVRLEDAFGNADGVASKGLALRNLFPYSREAVDYQKWIKGSGQPQ